jgi:hypothetical protein
VNPKEMQRRRILTQRLLAEAVDQLGPITDSSINPARKPVLEVIQALTAVSNELGKIRFDVHVSGGEMLQNAT